MPFHPIFSSFRNHPLSFQRNKRPHTFIGCDSLSLIQILNRLGSANRSKPFLKQYVVQMQRVHDELISVGKVSDANMPSDFLTKWISGRKLRQSIRFATNSDNFVPRPED